VTGRPQQAAASPPASPGNAPALTASPHNYSGQKETVVTATRQIIEITQINCKQDMSRWTRAHAGTTGINWSVYPGPGGTMIVVEHEEDRGTFLASQAPQAAQGAPAGARHRGHPASQSAHGLSGTPMDTVL
jgi:hypothetical protein